MRTIREFEERVHVEFAAGDIPGFVHLYAGEEASAVGVCLHLTDRDNIASTHRGHGHCIAKGCDVDGMMEEIFGRGDGLCGGKGGSMHIADLSKGMMGANGIVGGGPPLICGAALTAKTLKTGGVASRLRRRRRLQPGHHPRELQSRQGLEPAGDLRRRGQRLCRDRPPATGRSAGRSVEARRRLRHAGREVDGHDFFAVYEAAGEAIERARGGGGPTLLHVKLNRYYGHFEGDAHDLSRRRTRSTTSRDERDCLDLFRQRVTEAGLLEPKQLDEIDERNQVAHRPVGRRRQGGAAADADAIC